MTHYHINVRDAGGAPTVPSVKPPKPPGTGRATAPPKPPSAKPPAVPRASVASGVGALAKGVGQVGSGAASAVNRASGLVQRVAGFGEEFNRDASGRDEKGHYHFNIPSRGSRMRDKRRMRDQTPAVGASMSSTSGGVSSTSMMDAGTSEGAKKAAQTRRQGGVERGVRTGGNYGVDIKAGVNTRQVTKRPDPEPFRGYDRSLRRRRK